MTLISRREFLAGLAAGGAGVLLGARAGSTPSDHAPHIQKYNELGRTGLKVSDIIFGAGALQEPGVVRYAFDRGITGFDTAAGYSGMVSEEHIGMGLKGVRDRAVIITKQGFSRHNPFDRATVVKTLEESLRKLQTDYVDGLFIHSINVLDQLNNEDLLDTFLQFKRDGKVRFTGFSTHEEKVTLAGCVKPEYEEFVDAVMFRYNHVESEAIEPLIATMRKKGIGTIAMKTLMGKKPEALEPYANDDMSYPQACIAWVLSNPYIDCAALSMESFELVDSFVSVSGRRFDRSTPSG
jgi:aryl-alcohol dehydrogenase-like predicted oxidoreductase